ncbi:MAG: class I SAM-dependent methyltransferase [Pseudomonadota bacterium]|jgi:SAM-dependent methyltransferase
MIGREQRFHPSYTTAEKAYISLFGVPVVGLRIRSRNILHLLPDNIEPDQVLDAGSGPGVISFLLADKYPAATITGIDMSEEEISASREIASRAGITNARFETADISALPYADSFDLIVCVDILEHIEDDENALTKLADALKSGGTLLLHLPALYRRYPFFKKRINFDVPTHVRPGYQLDDVGPMLERAGLKVERSGHTYGLLETIANNISYMITGARKQNRVLYALAFPLLNTLSWLGRGARPASLGAGLYVLAKKPITRPQPLPPTPDKEKR